MLLEAFVKEKINNNIIECVVAIGDFKTIEQQFYISNKNVEVENILHRVIYIDFDFNKASKGIEQGSKLYFTLDRKLYVMQDALMVVKN